MTRFRFPGKPQKNFHKTRISLAVNNDQNADDPAKLNLSSNELANSMETRRTKIKYSIRKNQLILRKSRLNCLRREQIANRTTKNFASNCLVCATSLLGGGSGGGSDDECKLAENEFSNEICEFCANFLNRMLESNQILSCTKNNGFCTLLPQTNNKNANFERLMNDRCQACWLTVCLNTLNLSHDRKSKFTQMLPNFLQTKSDCDRTSRATASGNGSGAIASYCELSGSGDETTTDSDYDDDNCSEQLRNSRGPRYKNVCRTARTAVLSGFTKPRPTSVNGVDSCDDSNTASTNSIRSKTQKRRGRRKRIINEPKATATTASKNRCYDRNESSPAITISYWENYDLDEIYNSGFALIMSNEFAVKSICFLCGSAGQDELIYCANCCEPYHLYCINDQTIPMNAVAMAAAATAAAQTITDRSRIANKIDSKLTLNWFCKRCIPCENCGQVTRYKIQCQKCLKSYHLECFNTKLKLDQSIDNNLVCSKCLKCNSCGSDDNNLKLVGNSPYCFACFRLRKKGNFCPICQVCYDNNDYDTMMIECNNCKHWVHATCEKITADEYHVLSNLPQNIDYVCSICADAVGVASPKKWKQSVREDFAAKLLNVLRAFSKNRCARQLLKFAQQLRIEGGGADDDNAEETVTAISLAKIRTKIAKNSYVSLKEFRFDFETVLRSQNRCPNETNAIIESFRRILKEQFPWHCAASDETGERLVRVDERDVTAMVAAAVVDDDKDRNCSRTIDENEEITATVTDTNDNRFCALCKGYGDGRANWEGRLLYAAFNEWIHANCALWSAEVYEEIDGSLQNVSNAISRGRLIKCQFCAKKGASIGCCAKLCSVTYHFVCARLSNCLFRHDKTVYCPKHRQVLACDHDAVSGDQFCLDRPVFIEFFDSLTLQKQRSLKQRYRQPQAFGAAKKRKFFDADRIQVQIGSLAIRSLGRYHSKLSDTARGIVPVHLQCERFYWSISEPWKLVSYSLRITAPPKLVTDRNFSTSSSSLFSFIDNDKITVPVQSQLHFRVDHSLPERIVCEQLQEIERFHRNLVESSEQRTAVVGGSGGDLFDNFQSRTVFDTILDSDSRIDLKNHRYDLQFKNTLLLQVDGIDDSDDDDENPVKCSKCQCTYRTRFSYDRHLSTCYVPNIDFGSSDSGSGGDESSGDESDNKVIINAAAAADHDSDSSLSSLSSSIYSSSSSATSNRPKRYLSDESDFSTNHILKKPKYSMNDERKLEEPVANCEPQVYCSGSSVATKVEPQQYNPELVKFEPILEQTQPELQNNQYFEPHRQEQQPHYQLLATEQPPQPYYSQSQQHFQHTHSVQIPAPQLLLPQPFQFVQTFPLKTEPQFVFVQSSATNTVANQPSIILPVQQPQQPQTFYSTNLNQPQQQQPPLVMQPINFLISNQAQLPLPILVQSSPQPHSHLPPALPASWNAPFLHRPCPEQPKKKLPIPKLQKNRKLPLPTPPLQPPPVRHMQPLQLPPLSKPPTGEQSSIFSLLQTVNKIKMDEMNLSTNCINSQTKRPLNRQQKQPQQSIPVSQPLRATVTTSSTCPSATATRTVPSPDSNTVITTTATITTTTTAPASSDDSKLLTKSLNLNKMYEAATTAAANEFSIKSEPFDFNKENNRNFENLKTEAGTVGDCETLSKVAVTATESVAAVTPVTVALAANCTTVTLTTKTEAVTTKTLPSQSQLLPPLLLPLPLPPPPPPPPPLQQQPQPPLPPPLPPPSIFRNYYSHSHRSYHDSFYDRKPKNNRYDLLLDTQATAHNNRCYDNIQQFRFEIKSTEINEQSAFFDDIWPKTVDLVQKNRQKYRLRCLPASNRTHVSDFFSTFGLQSNAVRFLLEQLPGAQKCKKYSRQFDWFFERTDKNNNKRTADEIRLRQRTKWKRRQYADRIDEYDDKSMVFVPEENMIFRNDCDNDDSGDDVDDDDDDDVNDDDSYGTFCARIKPYNGSKKKPIDMFSWLASEQRVTQLTATSVRNQKRLPSSLALPSINNHLQQQTNGFVVTANATAPATLSSLQTLLPLTFSSQQISNNVGGSSSGGGGGGNSNGYNRQIKERTAKLTSVYPSQIHGYGLYCLEDIECGEMVIQYTGEIVRSSLTDKRERYYCSKNIGCYMFRIDDNFVIDATMKGNAARFINHSCEPNCYSKIVEVFGRKRIFIFALRKVRRGEELTYDYKFPLEEDKIPCTCTSRKCRKYLN